MEQSGDYLRALALETHPAILELLAPSHGGHYGILSTIPAALKLYDRRSMLTQMIRMLLAASSI